MVNFCVSSADGCIQDVQEKRKFLIDYLIYEKLLQSLGLLFKL